MPIVNLFKVSQADRNQFCTKVIESSAPKVDYYFLVILSTLIVAFGLLADNIILVIGGMLVTPILSAILAISLGMVINEYKVIIRSVRIFSFSIIFAVLVSLFAGLATNIDLTSLKLINSMTPTLSTILAAVVAGVAASYTWVKPELNETLPGIAVTVTLIPPLTAIGLCIGDAQWGLLQNVFNVFVLNVVGIILSSLLVFSLMEFYKAKQRAVQEIKEEEKEIKKEKKKLAKK